jgi:hypothetical protein
MGWRHRGVIVGIALLLAPILPVVRYLNRSDVAHQSIQTWLPSYGVGVYKYHSDTGQWPSQTADFTRTLLPQRFRHWRELVDDQTIVIVWHKDLKPDPRANAGRILAYHNKGLYARLGRVWVCWGDLRTEYIKLEDLRAHLEADTD